ncbi:MAG TPA: tetratricopeptide repeat protein [Rhizomicrobium sp.]|nr:tetratricopeptide repeat protein [Rhizomicrobium sp.]
MRGAAGIVLILSAGMAATANQAPGMPPQKVLTDEQNARTCQLLEPDATAEQRSVACTVLINGDLYSGEGLAAIYLYRGIAREDLERLAEAERDYSRALEIFPSDDGYRRRAMVRCRIGDNAGSDADFTYFLSRNPSDSTGLFGRGLCYNMQKKYEDASRVLDKALAVDPIDKGSYYERGIAKYERRDYGGAIADFTHALAPKDGAVYAARSFAYIKAGQNDRALADINTAIGLHPTAMRYRTRGLIYGLLKRYPEALADFDAALALKPSGRDAARTHYARGAALRKMNRSAEADAEYDAAIAADSTWGVPYVGRANLDIARHDFGAADADLDKAVSLTPDDSYAWHNRGFLRWLEGRYAEAVSDLTRSIAVEPKPLAYYNRGQAYLSLGRYGEAMADFAAAAKLEPLSAKDVAAICRTKLAMGLPLSDVRASCEVALDPKLTEKSADVYVDRAAIDLREGKAADAIEDANAAIAMKDPLHVEPNLAFRGYLTTADSLYLRGLGELRLGRTAEGTTDIAAAKVEKPKIADDYAKLGVTN